METIENGFGGWVHDGVPASRLTSYRSSFKVIHWPPKYLTEGHFWPSICLFVCEQDNSKTDRWILLKFSGYVQNGKRKIWLNFGSDPDRCLDLLDPWNLILKTDNSKTYGCIWMKFSGNVLNGTRNKWLDFGSDLDHCLDHPDPGCQMCLCTI